MLLIGKMQIYSDMHFRAQVEKTTTQKIKNAKLKCEHGTY